MDYLKDVENHNKMETLKFVSNAITMMLPSLTKMLSTLSNLLPQIPEDTQENSVCSHLNTLTNLVDHIVLLTPSDSTLNGVWSVTKTTINSETLISWTPDTALSVLLLQTIYLILTTMKMLIKKKYMLPIDLLLKLKTQTIPLHIKEPKSMIPEFTMTVIPNVNQNLQELNTVEDYKEVEIYVLNVTLDTTLTILDILLQTITQELPLMVKNVFLMPMPVHKLDVKIIRA